jgi:hypothetical protein
MNFAEIWDSPASRFVNERNLYIVLPINEIDTVLPRQIAEKVIGFVQMGEGNNLPANLVIEAIAAGCVDRAITGEYRRRDGIGNFLFQLERTIDALVSSRYSLCCIFGDELGIEVEHEKRNSPAMTQMSPDSEQ